MIMKPATRIHISPAALASMADLSCMEISSRTARSRESWSIIVKVFSPRNPPIVADTRFSRLEKLFT